MKKIYQFLSRSDVTNFKFCKISKFNLEDLNKHRGSINSIAYNDAGSYNLSVLKEYDYLKWRYCISPKKYSIFGVKSLFGNLKAVLVFAYKENNEPLLVDFLGLSYLKQAVGAYLKESKYCFKTWIPKDSLESFFSSLYIETQEAEIPVVPVGRSFWKGLDWDWANNNFHYSMGDCDLF